MANVKKIRIGVLCSGGGTNLQAILGAQEAGLIPHGEVTLVISDHIGAYALERAKRYGIATKIFDVKQYPDRAERERLILEALEADGVKLVVFAGFMSVLSERFVSAYKNAIINVHPALIPAFCGMGMYGLHVHEAALARGVKVTGATVHYVTEECDGGPIILQKAVEVEDDDTPETLQKRVMREAEWVILPRAVEMVAERIAQEG